MSGPTAPPGWYPNPEPSGEGMRYWDGGSWTDPPAPTPDAHQLRQHAPAAKPDPTLAWVIALLPLAAPLVAFLAPEAVELVSFGIVAAMIACAVADSKRLQKHGIEVTWWWALLMGVVYLAVRAKRSGTTVAIPLVGGFVVAASLLLSFTAAAVWSVPEVEVERQVEAWLDGQGYRGRVECDDDLVGVPGDTLRCNAWIGGQPTIVTVTLEDDGGYVWELG